MVQGGYGSSISVLPGALKAGSKGKCAEVRRYHV